MKILTLCEKCRLLYEMSYSVKKYHLIESTTKMEEKCAHCHKKRPHMGMYIIDSKKKRA